MGRTLLRRRCGGCFRLPPWTIQRGARLRLPLFGLLGYRSRGLSNASRRSNGVSTYSVPMAKYTKCRPLKYPVYRFEEFNAGIHKPRKKPGDHHPLRKKIGKVAELASGYQGGYGAWLAFGADKHLEEAEIKDSIKAWRHESPNYC